MTATQTSAQRARATPRSVVRGHSEDSTLETILRRKLFKLVRGRPGATKLHLSQRDPERHHGKRHQHQHPEGVDVGE